MSAVISWRRRATALVLIIVATLSSSVVQAAQIDEEDVEQARQEREQAARDRAAALTDLETAVATYEALNAELQEVTFRVGRVRSQIDLYESQSRELRDLIRARAVDSYMNGEERDGLSAVFNPDMVQQSIIAREVLALAVDQDSSSLDSLLAVTAEMQRLQEELATDSARLEELRVEADAVVVRMNQLFAEADAEFSQAQADFVAASAALAEQRRREEEERQRREEAERARDLIRAALGSPSSGVPMSVTPGVICPIAAPTSFINSWHFPRPGGRLHLGVDMWGAYRAPLVAVADGVAHLNTSTLGGTVIHLWADHQVDYFYAHLDGYAPGLVDGQRVTRGQLIGYVGDTGDAAPGAYHLHFGIRPGNTINVNPYFTVRAVCP
jgi:murein DD-endopeptidase MepM/ murein hydrolase activator NlpD